MKTALPNYPITKKIWTTIKPAITGWSTALQTTLKAHPSAPQQLLFVSAWKPEITSHCYQFILRRRKPKPPHIVLRDIIGINELLLCIEEVCSLNSVHLKSSVGESVRINANDSDSYRKIVRQLEELKIEFHSYQLKEDKQI